MNNFKEIRFEKLHPLLTLMENIWKIIQQQIQNENTKILILVGTSFSGRTTLFRYLCGDQLIYEKNNQKYELKFNSNSFDYNPHNISFYYFLDKQRNHLILDFHKILNEDSMENFIGEELYLRLIKKYQIKFMYILKQSQNKIEQRGANIQQFIKNYLGGKIENLILILNFYNEELTNQELIESVKEQFQEVYDSTNYQSFVFRKINQQEMLQNEFSNEKRDQIWQCIIKQHPIHFLVDKFPLNQNIVSILNQMFTNPFKQILSTINKSYNGMVHKLNLNELENLQKCLNILQQEVKCNYTNPKFWIESFQKLAAEISNIFNKQVQDFNFDFDFAQLQLVFESLSNIISKCNVFADMRTIVINITQTLIKSIEDDINQLNRLADVTRDTQANQQKIQYHNQESNNIYPKYNTQKQSTQNCQKQFSLHQEKHNQVQINQFLSKFQNQMIINQQKNKDNIKEFLKELQNFMVFRISQIVQIFYSQQDQANEQIKDIPFGLVKELGDMLYLNQQLQNKYFELTNSSCCQAF